MVFTVFPTFSAFSYKEMQIFHESWKSQMGSRFFFFFSGGKEHNGFETSEQSAISSPYSSWQMPCQGVCSLKAVLSVTIIDQGKVRKTSQGLEGFSSVASLHTVPSRQHRELLSPFNVPCSHRLHSVKPWSTKSFNSTKSWVLNTHLKHFTDIYMSYTKALLWGKPSRQPSTTRWLARPPSHLFYCWT